MQSINHTLEFVQQHKDALAGSKIQLEKAKQKSRKGGIMSKYWQGWYDGAKPLVDLYEMTLTAYLAEDPVFKNWEATKKKFLAKAKKLGVTDPEDRVIEMLATFFV